MRILHFCEAFSPLSETFIYDTYVGQLRSGMDVHLATLSRIDEARSPAEHVHVLRLPSRIHPARILAQVRGVARRLPVWERPFSIYSRALRHALKRLRPQLIHAHFGTGGVIAEQASRGLGIPLVVTMYGHDISRLPHEARWRARYDVLFERTGLLAVLSEDMRRAALKQGVKSTLVEVVHLARDIGALQFDERLCGVRKWLSVGRLVEKKGFDDAIRAVALLRDRNVPIQLEIIGNGPLMPKLLQLVSDLKLTGIVTLRGSLPNTEVVRALREADAFVLCSKTARDGDQEGTPTVLIEAQALGLPCVSTRHAGIPEMFPASSHWLLANEGAVAEVAERMERLTSLPPETRREVVRAGRTHVEQQFALDGQVARYAALYQNVVTRVAERSR